MGFSYLFLLLYRCIKEINVDFSSYNITLLIIVLALEGISVWLLTALLLFFMAFLIASDSKKLDIIFNEIIKNIIELVNAQIHKHYLNQNKKLTKLIHNTK